MRTAVDIDDPVRKEIKRLRRREGKSLGRLVSGLLAQALADLRRRPKREPDFRWIAKPMGAHVNLSDKHALLNVINDARR